MIITHHLNHHIYLKKESFINIKKVVQNISTIRTINLNKMLVKRNLISHIHLHIVNQNAHNRIINFTENNKLEIKNIRMSL